MNRIVIGVIAIVLLVIAALVILPVIFKDDIVQLVKDEINERVDARVDFGDFGMSLLPHFPDFSLSIEKLTVVGIGDFEGDSLVSIGEIELTFDLMSVLFGDEIEIEKIGIDRMNALARVLEDGRVNWDIVKGDDGAPAAPTGARVTPQTAPGARTPGTPTEPASRTAKPGGPPVADETAGAPFKIALRELRIERSNVRYDDAEGDVHADLREFDFSLRGDFTKDFSTLKTKANIATANLAVGAIPYLNQARVDFRADIDADLANSKYTLKANELLLNELALEWEGYVAVPGSEGDGGDGGTTEGTEKDGNGGLDLDVRFSAKQTEVKTILSLIPVVYTRDFENVEASGKLTFDGFVRGRYSDGQVPTFGIRLFVEGGRVKYPDLPKSMDKIDVNLQVNNPGGDLDRTIVNFSRLHVEIAGNPIDIRLVIKTPTSDPEIFCQVNGKVDLASLGDVIPLEEGEKITGRIDADIRLQGKVSAIEKRNYEAFQAVGGLAIEGMSYRSTDFPKGIIIDRANLRFSPQYVDIKSLECRIGRSDVRASGKVENLLPFAMTDEAVLGINGELSSRLLDLNDFISDEGKVASIGKTGTGAEAARIVAAGNVVPGERIGHVGTVAENGGTGNAWAAEIVARIGGISTVWAEEIGQSNDAIPSSFVEVPGNLDLRITSSIDKIVYDRYTADQVKGNLKVKDRVLTLENVGMDILGGRTTLSGTYDTRKAEDPVVSCHVSGKVDLARLGDVITLEEGEKITGRLDTDIRLQGKVSAIEKGNYETLQAVGGLSIAGMSYQSAKQPKGITIDKANLQFTPQYVDLKSLECRIGRSDLRASGKVENFIAYAMTDDAVLQGRCELSSRLLDLSDLIFDEGADAAGAGATKEKTPFSAVQVPRNVDLQIASSIDKLVYDRISATQVKGSLKVKDQVMTLENLGMDVVGGKTTLSGTYDTRKPDEPKVNVDLNMVKLDIPQAFRMFDTFRALAPIAEHCTGLFSSTLKLSGTLGQDMTPVLSTLTGNGELLTDNAIIKGSGTLNQVAAALKSDRFKELQFRNLKLPFQFKEGRVHLKSTDVRLDKMDGTLSGSHGFDQSLDYKMKMRIPSSEFGGNFNAFLGSVSSQLAGLGLGIDAAKMAEAVQVDLLIRGTVTKPTVSIGGLNLVGGGGKAVGEQLSEELRKQRERIMQDAERRAQAVRDEGRKAAEAVRKEGYAQADRIQNEAKGKDPISQAAAKAAADKVRSETDKKADRMIREADEKAAKIIEDARKEADSLGNG